MAKAHKSEVPWSEIGAASMGMAIGGVLGMLFSPNSGKKNRQIIAKQTKKVKATAVKTVKRARAKVAAR